MKQVKSKARTIIIGDIQGCFDEFEALLKKIDLQKEDTVYLVGDMINK
ncbi:MAG: metallophosphoesterase [Candidatus Peribacteria bacterium]|nr:MAG: metallophosphoesterase [Candidatus Peribacteria bacterium]